MKPIVKLKVIAVFSLGVLAYGIWGWRYFQPAEPGAAVSLVADGIHWSGIGMGIVFAVLLSGLGSVLGGSVVGKYIGPLAVPAGLTALSIRSGGMERLLIEHVGPARSAMFYGMIGEVLLWGFFIAIGFVVTRMVMAGRAISAGQPDETSREPELSTSESSQQHSVHQNHGFWKLTASRSMVNGLTAAIFCSIVTLLLLLVLVQTETVLIQVPSNIGSLVTLENIQVGSPPCVQQSIFALGISFFLSTLVAHQLFEARLGWFLMCPILASILAYALGAFKSVLPVTNVSPQFVPKLVLFATILPVQFVGIGVLIVITGYWYSVEIHSHRRARHSSA